VRLVQLSGIPVRTIAFKVGQLRPDLPRSAEGAGRFSFCASRRPCTRPLGSILHAVAVHAPDIVQPSHYAKIDNLLDGLHARVSAIIS
jgi:hypothetical protein